MKDRQEILRFVAALEEDGLTELMRAVSRRLLIPRWVIKSEMGDITDERWVAFLDYCEDVKWIMDDCCEIDEVWHLFLEEIGDPEYSDDEDDEDYDQEDRHEEL